MGRDLDVEVLKGEGRDFQVKGVFCMRKEVKELYILPWSVSKEVGKVQCKMHLWIRLIDVKAS